MPKIANRKRNGIRQLMRKVLDKSSVRSWQEDDAESLAKYADNRKIWLNLRDAFPHPYTLEDAHNYLSMVFKQDPETYFAIEVDGEAAGSIGFVLHSDVERVSAEIGYWLGETFWNRGIMSEVARFVTSYAIKSHSLTRVYAVPFEWNTPSFRVLENAGYQLEGRMRRSAMKDGKIVDQLLYAYVKEEMYLNIEQGDLYQI